MDNDITLMDASADALPPPIDGAAAAAILLMLLSEAEAAAILAHFDADDVRTLGTAMFAASRASETQIEIALDQFVAGSRNLSALAVRAEPKIRSVITTALGNVRADNILAAIAPQSSAKVLDTLRWMEPGVIAALLANEHPQVGAIILAVLTPQVAGDVLEGIDDARQADLAVRAARLTSVSRAAIADLEEIVSAATSVSECGPDVKLGGPGDVARIANAMSKASSERMLKTIRKHDKLLAARIEEDMFVFDNLLDLDAKSIGSVLRSVEASVLALALRGASEAMVERMLGAMSARAAQSIRDDMAEGAPAKRSDVDDAQKTIIAVARKLAADGTIIMGGKGDDYV